MVSTIFDIRKLTVAAPQRTEPSKNIQVPKMRIHFLPKISENFAKSGSIYVLHNRKIIRFGVSINKKKKKSSHDLRNASNVKIYAVATQDTIDIWLKSDPIRGKAVETMVLKI